MTQRVFSLADYQDDLKHETGGLFQASRLRLEVFRSVHLQ